MNSNTIQIHGDNNGQVASNNGGTVIQTATFPPAAPSTPADLVTARKELQQLVSELDQKIAAELPHDQQAPALERSAELKDALLSEKPDLSTMEYVKKWFLKNAPKVAGVVSGLIVHPIVGKLVEAGGELVAAEFRRRFDPANQ